MTTIGEQLVDGLRARDVEVIFGIPGVHTINLYRGLAQSEIRHVTPRHEQGAGFMADGYARVSGKPGVALVITGPGLTNTLTPMAQSRADSVPTLTISGVNAVPSLGKGLGFLHELPNQHQLAQSVALTSVHVGEPADLSDALDTVFRPFRAGRPGPTHLQIPLDVAGQGAAPVSPRTEPERPSALPHDIADVAARLSKADTIVIVAGGGAKNAAPEIQQLAEMLDAPVVLTVNARGMMHKHSLCVPASPSLQSVRALINQADVVLALGTELGPTDYDMYSTGEMPRCDHMIRVDICEKQLSRHPVARGVCAAVHPFVTDLIAELGRAHERGDGNARAQTARHAAWDEIGSSYRHYVEILDAMRDAVPDAVFVGDSTQAIYAGNLYYDHDRASGWFNAATGYGALGYAIPASIGAAIAAPKARVLCLTGDGGAQFTLTEIMTAVDERLPIVFVIWNNHGYGEIATSMIADGVTPVGCDPTPPAFDHSAASFGIAYERCDAKPEQVAAALQRLPANGPSMLEISIPSTPKR
ncbi:MAG: 5-guanidino-2-oxopentanoate decarboxylase [Paracoccaceae bacterium]